MVFRERDIYVGISKILTGTETIKFDVVRGCATAYLLEQGCSKLGLPPMTVVIYKPRLIWNTQETVCSAVEGRKDIVKAVLIYSELYDKDGFKVRPDRNMGKMETMSYDELALNF